jgi:hypothetical protein
MGANHEHVGGGRVLHHVPTQAAYFFSPIYLALSTIMGAAGLLEQKLLGVNADSGLNAQFSRAQGGMEQGGRQGDST